VPERTYEFSKSISRDVQLLSWTHDEISLSFMTLVVL